MHARVIYNGQLLPAERVRLPTLTAATLYGRGVFTTLAVYQSRPFMWAEHFARLVAHAARAGVDSAGLDEAATGAQLSRLVETNRVERGRVRVMLLGHAIGGQWKNDATGEQKHDATGERKNDATAERASDLLIITGEARSVPREGLSLTISPYRTNTLSPLAGIKSVSYLEHLLALEEARGRSFDEAVVLNERGEVVSATAANLFWVRHGTIHTPALATAAMAGTTRARIFELASEMAFPLVEGVYEISDLAEADEIFLTSSTLGVAIATTFDFRRYAVAMGSVALRLAEAFRQLTLQDA